LARITLDQESTPTIVKLDQDAKLDDSLDTSLQQIAPSIRKVKRPRAIILVPSRHLVHQVTSTAKEMSHYCRLRVVGLHSKTKHARESYQDQPIDILVSTPTTLLHLIEEEGFSFSQLQTLVLDEADTLFDKNFLPETSKVIQQVQSFSANRKNSMIPCYLFTATFPQTLNQTVSTLFPTETGQELVKLTTPSLHRPVKSVHHAFLRLNQSVTKPNLLVESIKKSRDLTKRLLVFCNTQDTASKVETFLKEEKKVPNVVLLSSHLPLDLLKKNLDSFLVQNDQFVIAISTDLASRGLDTLQVGHVINYDFPLTVMDYVHRSGRTGRYGRKGRCTSFLEKRDLKLASDIEEKIKRGTSL
jgi:superfamily II DNA/RNA helicase